MSYRDKGDRMTASLIRSKVSEREGKKVRSSGKEKAQRGDGRNVWSRGY